MPRKPRQNPGIWPDFEKRYVEQGESMESIAESSGIPIGTVRNNARADLWVDKRKMFEISQAIKRIDTAVANGELPCLRQTGLTAPDRLAARYLELESVAAVTFGCLGRAGNLDRVEQIARIVATIAKAQQAILEFAAKRKTPDGRPMLDETARVISPAGIKRLMQQGQDLRVPGEEKRENMEFHKVMSECSDMSASPEE